MVELRICDDDTDELTKISGPFRSSTYGSNALPELGFSRYDLDFEMPILSFLKTN